MRVTLTAIECGCFGVVTLPPLSDDFSSSPRVQVSFVSLTTVGYGDIVPQTLVGRTIIAAGTVRGPHRVCGVLLSQRRHRALPGCFVLVQVSRWATPKACAQLPLASETHAL